LRETLPSATRSIRTICCFLVPSLSWAASKMRSCWFPLRV